MPVIKWIFFLMFLTSTAASDGKVSNDCNDSKTVTFSCVFLVCNATAIESDSCYACEVHNRVDSLHACKQVLNITQPPHSESKTHSDVNCLNITNKVVHYFPADIENSFGNLEAIIVRNSSLREIHEKNLKPFIKLRYLNLRDNQLKFIDKNLFSHNKELKLINLKGNNFTKFDWSAFINLSELKLLYIFKMSITRESIKLIVDASHVTQEQCSSQANNPKATEKPLDETTKGIPEGNGHNKPIDTNRTITHGKTPCDCPEVNSCLEIIIGVCALAALLLILNIYQCCKLKFRSVHVDSDYEVPKHVKKDGKVEGDYAEVGLDTESVQYVELPNNKIGSDGVYEEIPGGKFNHKVEISADYEEVGMTLEHQGSTENLNYEIESGYEELPGVEGQNGANLIEDIPDYAEVSFNVKSEEVPSVLPIYATVDKSHKNVKS